MKNIVVIGVEYFKPDTSMCGLISNSIEISLMGRGSDNHWLSKWPVACPLFDPLGNILIPSLFGLQVLLRISFDEKMRQSNVINPKRQRSNVLSAKGLRRQINYTLRIFQSEFTGNQWVDVTPIQPKRRGWFSDEKYLFPAKATTNKYNIRPIIY